MSQRIYRPRRLEERAIVARFQAALECCGSTAAFRFVRDRRGTAAVEFAFVLVMLLTILFGIIAFGFQFAIRVALSYAVTEGGHAAEAGLSSSERQSLASTGVSNVLNSFSPLIDPSEAVVSVSSEGMTSDGEEIVVSVSYTDTRFDIFPFLPSFNKTAVVQTAFFVADPSG
jgi:Flp pilus assembly protein TadG